MPERWRIRGESIAPAQQMTARSARMRSAPPPGSGDLDASHPSPLDHDPGDQRPRAHFQVGPRERRREVEERGAAAPAAPGGAVHRREAFLPVAVEIVGTLEPGFHAGFDEGLEQRVDGLRPGDGKRTVAAVVGIRSGVAGLRLAEVRQAVPVRPLLQAGDPGPLVVVERISADVHHAVDGGRAAEHLPARAVHAPPVHPRLRIGDVGPVVGGAVLRIGERGRHPNAPLPPRHGASRLDEQDPRFRVLGEPAGEHAPGGAGPDDDVVVAGGGHGVDLPNRRSSRPASLREVRQQNFTCRTRSGKTPSIVLRSGVRPTGGRRDGWRRIR